jgi:hypothetical protein
VKHYAGVRFADVLAPSERGALTRKLGSAGAAATSWNVAAERSYALVSLPDAAALDALHACLGEAFPEARIDEPPQVVLRVWPERERDLPGLAHALSGAGRPAGVTRGATDGNALVIEVDVRTTPLSSILALIDVELRGAGRRIEPVLPLADDVLAEVAGGILGEPQLDRSRLLETHLEALLGGDQA